MDFNQFKSQLLQKYDPMDLDIAGLNRVAVVKFEKDSRGKVSGRCAFGRVFRHREYEDIIKDGDTWVCELAENYSANNQYFAKGLVRVDPSFLTDLRADQIKMIAESIWDNHKDAVENVLFEQYGNVIDDRVNDIVSQKEALFEKEKENLLEKTESLNRTVELSDEIIQSLKEEKKGLESRVKELEERIVSMKVTAALPESSGDPIGNTGTVVRISDDTLHSRSFTDGMYRVRISADRSMMTVVPDEDGDVECRNGMIRLDGLQCIIDGEETLFRYFPETGRVVKA